MRFSDTDFLKNELFEIYVVIQYHLWYILVLSLVSYAVWYITIQTVQGKHQTVSRVKLNHKIYIII